jgi:amino acid transporter
MSNQRMEATIVSPQAGPALERSLSLLQATLYGLGVTIGAGIYVLVGEATARAGMHAPLAFLLAAALMALSAASRACGRLPVAAGEAAYVREAFRSTRWLRA